MEHVHCSPEVVPPTVMFHRTVPLAPSTQITTPSSDATITLESAPIEGTVLIERRNVIVHCETPVLTDNAYSVVSNEPMNTSPRVALIAGDPTT